MNYFAADILPTALTTTPWEVELAKQMYAETGDSVLKSFFGTQGWNTGLIDDLVKLSTDPLLPDADRDLYMAANTNVNDAVVQSFNNNLSAYQGKNIKEGPAAALESILQSGVSTAAAAPKIANMIPIILGVLAIGITGYLIYAGKKGTKLTPF